MPRYEPPLAPDSDNSYAHLDSYAHPGYPQRDEAYPEQTWSDAPPGRADAASTVPVDPWHGSGTGASGAAPHTPAPPVGPVDPVVDPVWDPASSEPPAWASGEEPRPRGGFGVRRLVLVLGVTLLICGAASVTGYLLVRDEKTPVTDLTAPDPTPATSTAPSAAPTASATPLPQSSTDVRFVAVGQCVRNEGGNDDPKLTITPCGPRTYEVLERFDGATTGKDDARSKCAAVPGYTDWYFFDSPLDVLDYVLCLKSR